VGTSRITKRSKVRPLSDQELGREVLELAQKFPEYVGTSDADGRFLPGVVPASLVDFPVPAVPLKPGAQPAIDPTEIREKWEGARARLRRDHTKVTLAAIGTELGVSEATAKRYRRTYNLRLRD
jgi:hypothetical protein